MNRPIIFALLLGASSQAIADALALGVGRYTSRKCEELEEAEDRWQSAKSDLKICAATGNNCEMEMQEYQDAKDEYEAAEVEADDDCE